MDGFEAQASKNALLPLYYGGFTSAKDVAIDSTGKPVGYGFTGSAADPEPLHPGTHVRVGSDSVEEQELRSAGADQSVFVYFPRTMVCEPLDDASRQAHDNMVYVDVRYTFLS